MLALKVRSRRVLVEERQELGCSRPRAASLRRTGMRCGCRRRAERTTGTCAGAHTVKAGGLVRTNQKYVRKTAAKSAQMRTFGAGTVRVGCRQLVDGGPKSLQERRLCDRTDLRASRPPVDTGGNAHPCAMCAKLRSPTRIFSSLAPAAFTSPAALRKLHRPGSQLLLRDATNVFFGPSTAGRARTTPSA